MQSSKATSRVTGTTLLRTTHYNLLTTHYSLSMRYTGPKARRVRRQGFNIYGSDKYDKILAKKPSPPGMQAAAKGGKMSKLSEYGKQLLEKQKACFMYGINDRQLRAIYKRATQTEGQSDTMIRVILERRLDNVVYRSGLAKTRLQSRQFASHGMFTINGVRVTIPSYQVKAGDVITVRANRKSSPVFPGILSAHEKYVAPSWMKVNPSAISIEITELPSKEEHFDKAVDMRKVIGFYSR